jgi:assimilatory nitrate reductase catalytic subunit
VNAIINCHLATGRIGRAGMGPFSVTGQPSAMGGREVGGLANQLAAHMRLDSADDRDRVRRFWGAPRMPAQPGLKAVELFDAMLDGRVKAIWIAGTNPAVSMPRAGRVRSPPVRSSWSRIAGPPTRRASPMSCYRPPAGARRTAP